MQPMGHILTSPLASWAKAWPQLAQHMGKRRLGFLPALTTLSLSLSLWSCFTALSLPQAAPLWAWSPCEFQIASSRHPAASPLALDHTGDGSTSRSAVLGPIRATPRNFFPAPPQALSWPTLYCSPGSDGHVLCPQSGLEDGDLYDGAWCAEPQDAEPWFQVDARHPTRFSGIITQGRNSVWR